ncbi:hypothetical protein AZA_83738 [Nitrospirillum viridazoti Y2]|nr:hypothetical protein AZA_83738 [Nitrospirillum amazonense Y2]
MAGIAVARRQGPGQRLQTADGIQAGAVGVCQHQVAAIGELGAAGGDGGRRQRRGDGGGGDRLLGD